MVEGKATNRKKYTELRSLVDKYSLNTICASEAAQIWVNAGVKVPQLYDSRKHLYSFLWFLGCKTGRPETLDWDEPEKVARSIKIMNIKHAVITSVQG
jgi:lipoic acid synthetase